MIKSRDGGLYEHIKLFGIQVYSLIFYIKAVEESMIKNLVADNMLSVDNYLNRDSGDDSSDDLDGSRNTVNVSSKNQDKKK
ncbi:hypothetical protein RO3G_04190 [Rhizopus delemar RA 99-880]|uniref:Uncharacterized protein n=1 Tax=Rhizopus delemar (strain RA 99-880 / ATCC MYA-4621 / FGSC 9543 / NRRL 43880) TaxID=246409 RepID=I1BTF5_RHIO9|nr:hypothetical protein RO3G_04190 [Rhizopus delemar RA 99-880]|eukprot:EIE79485.1 hypothetical protein RO3G_04190 [Rhizopus delemar RA 99-880]